MTRYLLGRLLAGAVTLFIFVTLLFFLVNLAVPGDFTSQFILTADQRASVQHQLGLDRSLWAQYLTWLQALATLNLGDSYSGVGIADAIRSSLALSLTVLVTGVGIAFALGAWLGRVTAWTVRRRIKTPVTFLAIVCLTAFPPALGFLLERATLNTLGRSTASQLQSLDHDRWVTTDLAPSTVLWRMLFVLAVLLALAAITRRVLSNHRTRLPVSLTLAAIALASIASWHVLGIGGLAIDLATSILVLTLGVIVLTFGEILLIARATMEDAVHEDYVMAARAKGLAPRVIRDRHAGRAALLPMLSRFVVAIPYFLTGLIILESVFHVAGMGTLMFEALRLQDTPLLATSLVVVGAITVVLRIALDVAQAALDPRQRSALESSYAR